MQEPGQKQNQDGLGDLRGLKGEMPSKANPAMGVVRAGDQVDQHKQQRGDAQGGVNEAGRVIEAVIDVHEGQHEQHASQRPASLPAQVGKLGVIARLGHNRGGGKDHGEPDDHKQECGKEQPFVYSDAR